MIILPFVVVLAVVGVVVAVRRARPHAVSPASAHAGDHPAATVSRAATAPTSRVGILSLVALAAGLLLWAFTRTSLPIYYAGSIGGIAFVLAVVAVVQFHDRSPALLLPLVFVPLAAAATAAFVLLQ